MCFFFFFKQKTAYEIYQCDWSSDVCSSDLPPEWRKLGDKDNKLNMTVLALSLCRYSNGVAKKQIGRASCRERV